MVEKMHIEPLMFKIGASEMNDVATSSSAVVRSIKQHMFSPDARKKAPRFSPADVAGLCGKTYQQMYGPLKKMADSGIVGEKVGNRLTYSLPETRKIIKSARVNKNAVEKSFAVTIAIANFKGGVTKTTTAATLAQGLSLRGLEVLIIDLDPQGSLTNLFGLLSDLDVDSSQTVFSVYSGDETSIDPAITPTYWDGIDLVAASPDLHNAEFILPARQRTQKGFEFWRVLDQALESARSKYDVIIIDTPPSLSYSTINGIMAADGLIMPLPPSPLDFASSAQFWSLCNDLIKKLTVDVNGSEKKFCFIDVLLTRVDKSIGVSNLVRDWIVGAYGSKVLPIEIPRTSTADTASAAFGTVYDLHTNPSIAKTLKRARDAYDDFVLAIEKQIYGVWLGAQIKGELNVK